MKIVFFGTPSYVIPICEAIRARYNRDREKELIAVVTQEPKPMGRKGLLEWTPVDTWAYKRNISIIRNLSEVPHADVGVVASYGKIVPPGVLSKFKYGILNIHPSLLPKYRGASPIQGAIAAGETETGVSVIKMDSLMDHGPIVSSFKEEIKANDTMESLRERLFSRAASFVVDLLPNFVEGKINLKEQDHKNATFTTLVEREHGFLDPKIIFNAINGKPTTQEFPVAFIKDFVCLPDSVFVERLMRALYPWPGVWTQVKINNEAKRLKILKVEISNNELVLQEVQLEGKNPVTWEQFRQGYPKFSFSF